MIGTTLGHYRIVDKIGEGGMGEVYRAHDERLDRDVAVKVLPSSVAQDAERIARFEREAKAVARLEHPNILAIHDFGTDDGVTYSVTELLDGETLRERLDGGALGWRKAAEVGASIADGLAAAHGAGIIHRDLKPDNLFITEDGRVKILDFGLARDVTASTPDETHSPTVSRYTDPGAVMGTVGYMSPEQVRGEPADARSDIFALGSVLYEMATGRRAFARDTAAETMTAILKEEPSEISSSGAEAPPGLAGTIRRCLEKKPQARFQSASDLAYNLRTISSASATTAVGPALRARGRARTVLWLTAAAVVAAAAVALTLYFGRGGDEQPVGIGASGRPAVAVMPFDCTAASEDLRWLRQGVPDMLVTGLAQTQGLDVVSSERLLEILDRLAPESAASIAPRHVLEVARRAGAGAVVVGTVMGGGPELRIDVRVQDPADGRLLFAHGVRGEELFALVDEITKQIRVGLGLATAPFDRGIAELTSESLEAYRLYVEGFNAARNMRSSDAHELFRRAVEIDPSFTMAYYELSISPYSFDPALRDEYREKTLQGLDRLSERERLQVGSRAASWEGDDERALALQEELVARYPDQADAYRRLAYLYRTVLGDTEKEMQALERGIRAVPTYGPLRNRFAYQLLKAGRFNEGIRQLEEYAQMAPEEPNPHDGMGEAYLMFGRPEEAIAKFTDAIEVDDRFFISYLGRAWAYAVLGHYDKALSEVEAVEDVADGDEVPLIDALFFKGLLLAQVGRYREAELAVDEIHRLAEPTGVAILHFAAWSLSSMTALDRGDHFAAIESATRVLETPDRDRDLEEVVLVAHVLAGIGEAFSGRLAAAAEHQHDAAALLDHQDVNETWLYHSLEGEIALASGDLARAEAAFASGLPTGKISANRSASFFFDHTSPSRDWKARIHIARRDAAGAIAEYRRLLTPSADQKFVGVLEPRLVLELARLLDQDGDHEAARQEYRRFLDLWKNADPDLPELAEAQTRLARLETTSS